MKTLRLSSETESIKRASAGVVNFILSKNKDINKDILFDIKLCVEEAVRNAIVHGNRSTVDLPVDISYDIADNKISITIEDQGAGFRLKDLPDPTQAENLYKESGRGVYLIHRLMDTVTYNTKGNRVTMDKTLRTGGSDAG